MFPVLLSLYLLIALLGIGIVAFGIWKLHGKLKKFVILTGASILGFFVSVLLHNAIYGLFIIWFGTAFWDRIGMVDEPFFFIIAIFICPLGFLVGATGSLILVIRKGAKGQNSGSELTSPADS